MNVAGDLKISGPEQRRTQALMRSSQEQRVVVRRPGPASGNSQQAWQCSGTVRVEQDVDYRADTKSRNARIISSPGGRKHGQPHHVITAPSRRKAVAPLPAAPFITPAQVGARSRGRSTLTCAAHAPKDCQAPPPTEASRPSCVVSCRPAKAFGSRSTVRPSEIKAPIAYANGGVFATLMASDAARGRRLRCSNRRTSKLAKDARRPQWLDVVANRTQVEHAQCHRQLSRHRRAGHRRGEIDMLQDSSHQQHRDRTIAMLLQHPEPLEPVGCRVLLSTPELRWNGGYDTDQTGTEEGADRRWRFSGLEWVLDSGPFAAFSRTPSSVAS